MFEISSLQVSYGQSEVIHKVNFSAKKNETVAIMGRNGMVKTTLFKALMGILPSKGGKISGQVEAALAEVSFVPTLFRAGFIQTDLARIRHGRRTPSEAP